MTKDKPRLEALRDRRQTVRISLADRAYTAVIRKLRWILPVAALGILAALLVWPKIEMEISEKRFAPTKVDRATLEKAATENRLANAKFSSVDAKGRPFNIRAVEAVQDSKNPDNVNLKTPSGTLKISETIDMTADAKTGVYEQKEQILTLNQDVVLTRTDGTVMKTSVMTVNLMTNDASTDVPVTISGPQGHLEAMAMTMKNSGALTIFKGPAKLVLTPKNSIDPKGSTP
ncbi:MAG: LPS export ABC transporter periplasmic protein LptC [Proteobacteria bacterium]|nr:LPS export ABC transporter periplasmic protein LptC [Pseudomonadota bacterium]